MSFFGKYTRQTIPDEVLAFIVTGGDIHLKVLNAGPMAGTGLMPDQAKEQGSIKNHWCWQVVVRDNDDELLGIIFSFEPDDSSSDKSDVAQYTGSIRDGSDLDDDRFSFYESEGDIPGTGSEDNYKPVRFNSELDDDRFNFYESKSNIPGTGSKDDYKPVRFSPAGSVGMPPALSDKGDALRHVVAEDESGAKIVSTPASISSTTGVLICQPVEGKPKPGIFRIKVVDYYSTSFSAVVVFDLPIVRDNLTFGDLIHALDERGMEPFFFRMINCAFFRCHDFM